MSIPYRAVSISRFDIMLPEMYAGRADPIIHFFHPIINLRAYNSKVGELSIQEQQYQEVEMASISAGVAQSRHFLGLLFKISMAY
ncbi:MAG: hypothetical protein AAGU74_15220, partial [Bacillota bacterium]